MNNAVFYAAGSSAALQYAKEALCSWGCSLESTPTANVTHLLLPVPSLDTDGNIRGGHALADTLMQLPRNITVVGGNLDHPSLTGYLTIDLLKDPYYLAYNAAITAHCALKLLLQRLTVTPENQKMLIIGWGRIGKCLAGLLRALGAQVTISARKDTDRAMIEALGYDTDLVPPTPGDYRAIFNTAPSPVLSSEDCAAFSENCLKFELASKDGIFAKDVIIARGLPGKEMPESSGNLIASTVIRLILNKE